MQDIIAILIAAVAAAFLMRRAWQRFANRRGSTCGSCPNCPSNGSVKSPPLVNISADMTHAKAQRR